MKANEVVGSSSKKHLFNIKQTRSYEFNLEAHKNPHMKNTWLSAINWTIYDSKQCLRITSHVFPHVFPQVLAQSPTLEKKWKRMIDAKRAYETA